MFVALAFQFALLQGLLASAQSSLQLVSAPLAVKTPYFNGWTFTHNPNPGPDPLLSEYPRFYNSNSTLGWAGYVRVDDHPFQWMGNDSAVKLAGTVASDITPTKSIFTVEAGNIRFNVTFFTPIEPNDYIRQSMPFSYMYIDGFSVLDSKPHDVAIYSDVTAEWVTQNPGNNVTWNTAETSAIVYHNTSLQTPPQPLVDDGIAGDGEEFYAMLKRSGMTFQTGASNVTRALFSTNGTLHNTTDTAFRPVNGTPENMWPVFAFAVDLGSISPGSQPDPVVSALGLFRDPVIRYATSSVQNLSSFYMSAHNTPEAAITEFLQDFGNAQTRNSQLDDKIMTAANKVSSNYTQILSFVTRQIFASLDITVPPGTNGSFNTSDVRIFMKDMGRTARVNPVDVIYGAFPAFLYLNSSIVAGLLEPLLESQSLPANQNPYAAPDLGTQYPVISANIEYTNNTLAIDSSSSLLIMAYAHALKSGDISLLNRYNSTLQNWAQYLVDNTPHFPQGSVTPEGERSINLSNEELKSILGIYCMGQINEALGVNNSTFNDKATQLYQNWKKSAISGTHIGTVDGGGSSWGLIYNLFPAVLLELDLVEDDILSNQAQFYAQRTSEGYGFPLDNQTSSDTTYPHWMMWTAAAIPSNMNSVRDNLIGFVHQRATDLNKDFTLPMQYSASSGNSSIGLAGSAIHGAAFGLLALSVPNSNIVKGRGKKNKVGAIVGGVIGGVVGLVAFALIIFFFRRRRNRQRSERKLATIDSDSEPPGPRPQPFDLSGYSTVNNSNTNLRDSVVADGGQGTQDRETRMKQRRGGLDVVSHQPGAAPPLSSKRREALGATGPRNDAAPSVSAASTDADPHSTAASTSGAENLRAEMEQLRRDLDNIRNIAEPPPEYT